ncbi:cytochrome c oxidase subunit 7B, mitochondrial-like [Artibeus jamaicensis]|uniref:cytochrome c oxidase subunit 7B, mitochondrial-like n=1 Tax=Artibeus jamaicensis TaxID=9417 RepID=UPI00235B0917|nr:cytochrome c oxidase subunit 7B, mitochondrial-like [Artibeus jamaicensis]
MASKKWRFFARVLDMKFQQTSSCSCCNSVFSFTMFPLAKYTLGLFPVQSIRQVTARQTHQKQTPAFHDKYGNTLLAMRVTFCVVTWAYIATQVGVERNLSPTGRVTLKEWGDQ